MEEQVKEKGEKLKKVKQFFATHENIRQIVLFTLFSLICFAIEYISFTVLQLCLKSYNEPLDWFLFHYSQSGGGKGAFVAFLVSNILAQAATFVLNRKKTFKATNNVVISGIMFAIVIIAIIILNTYLGGVIGDAASKSMINSGTSAETAEVVSGYAGKLVGSGVAWVLSFLGNKFLVMRNWGGKKKQEDAEVLDVEPNEAQLQTAACDALAESAATEACGSLFSVVMKSAGNNKLDVIKAVRAAIDEDLAKVKDMIDNLPAVIAQGLNKTEAESMARPLTAIGAEIEIV
ncbi:MAG: ribosomal protein L7/L12 [Clostridia bacterium]|nr:ribosomal protein L7/L12 [Clostridia bacterium]